MNSQLHTGVFVLDIRAFDNDAAHLYEHLLIQTFNEIVESAGFSPYLFGWVGGETFESTMFIEYGMYSHKVEQLFKDFISKPRRINENLISVELLRVQAENKAVIDEYDEQVILEELRKLDKLLFIDVEADTVSRIIDINDSRPENLITLRPSKKDFRDIAVTIGMTEASLEDSLAFFRMTPIIFDAVNKILFSLGLYQREVGSSIRNIKHESIFIYSIYSLRRSTYTNAEIRSAVLNQIESLDLSNFKVDLSEYIAGFLTTPNWHTFPIDYYRRTGILASKSAIAKQLTLEKIEIILKSLKVEVTPAKQTHWDNLS